MKPDTLSIAEALKSAGLTQEQAAAITRAAEVMTGQKAGEIEARMNKDLSAALDRYEATTKILAADIKAELKSEIGSQTKWFVTIFIAALAANVGVLGLLKFFG